MHPSNLEMQTTTGPAQQDVLPIAAPKLRLLFSAGEFLDSERVLGPGECMLGRGGADGIGCPADTRISRMHARLRIQQAHSGAVPTVELFDCESHNGTFVNGHAIRHAVLCDNDVIRIGDSLLHLRYVSMDLTDLALPDLAGPSPAMARVRAQLGDAARAESPVLLEGETGTGKEVATRTLHELRQALGRTGALIAVNCSAIPAALAESELFGHVRGAFSGATESRPGHFRAAHGGTLFLDEIGDMPLDLQPKLLRALETRQVTPVGGSRLIECDLRIVSATNRRLASEVEAGRFRADLYSRIAALRIELPALRTRREDILPLLLHLWPGAQPRLTASLVERLLLAPWPLNVRELRNTVQWLRTAASNGRSRPLDAPLLDGVLPSPGDASSAPASPPSPRDATPRAHGSALGGRPEPAPEMSRLPPPLNRPPVPREELERLLQHHRGVIAHVAAQVGRSRRQVRRWLELYGLDRKGRKP